MVQVKGSSGSSRAGRGAGAAAAAFLGLAGVLAAAGAAAQEVGRASSVVREVTGDAGGTTRQLTIGSGVFSDETISTGRESNSQLLFRDETTLSIGPASAVVLDEFVYTPGGQASTFAVDATRGALRFVSGSSSASAYVVDTPTATIGVRGTIVDIFVQSTLTTVILTEGAAEVCVGFNLGGRDPQAVFRPVSPGECFGLTRPGTYLVVRRGGSVEGPRPWDGTLRGIVGVVPFPLYGWSLDLDIEPRYRDGTERLQVTDQITAEEADPGPQQPLQPEQPRPDHVFPREDLR